MPIRASPWRTLPPTCSPDDRSTFAAAALTTRGERQHVETVRVWQAGDLRHAHDLRREHLLEFAGDLFVVVLPLVLVQMG